MSASALADLLDRQIPIIPVIYCAKAIKNARYKTTVGEIKQGADHYITFGSPFGGWLGACGTSLTYVNGQNTSLNLSIHTYPVDVQYWCKGNDFFNNSWPQDWETPAGKPYAGKTPSQIGALIGRFRAKERMDRTMPKKCVLPPLAMCGVPHRLVSRGDKLYPPMETEKYETEDFGSVLIDLIQFGVQDPVCGTCFTITTTPSADGYNLSKGSGLNKYNDTTAVMAELHQKNMAEIAKISPQFGAIRTSDSGLPWTADDLWALEQKSLDALISALPSRIYYSLRASTVYGELELLELLRPVDGLMEINLNKLPSRPLSTKTVILLSPEIETLIDHLGRKAATAQMFEKLKPTSENAREVLEIMFGETSPYFDSKNKQSTDKSPMNLPGAIKSAAAAANAPTPAVAKLVTAAIEPKPAVIKPTPVCQPDKLLSTDPDDDKA